MADGRPAIAGCCQFLARRGAFIVSRLHLLTEAEGAHVGPDLFDVVEALLLAALRADVLPTGGQLAIREPNRLLFLVIDDHQISTIVLVFRPAHCHLPATKAHRMNQTFDIFPAYGLVRTGRESQCERDSRLTPAACSAMPI